MIEQHVRWGIRTTQTGLRLAQRRTLGSERFTWADLLEARLATAQVYVLYFPSRFDLPEDNVATGALRTFGENVANRTRVDFWDTQDPRFSEALQFFALSVPPAIVVATGSQRSSSMPVDDAEPTKPLYCISFTDGTVLSDVARIAGAVNVAHEVLMRCDRQEIAAYIRARKTKAIFDAIARLSAKTRDQIVALKPSFGLPGGLTIRLGG